jgi:hypothetical protein
MPGVMVRAGEGAARRSWRPHPALPGSGSDSRCLHHKRLNQAVSSDRDGQIRTGDPLLPKHMEPLPTASRGFADRPSGAGFEPFHQPRLHRRSPRFALLLCQEHVTASRVESRLASPFGEFLCRQLAGFDWTWCPFARGVPPSLEALATTDREYAELPRGSLGRGMQQLRDRRGGGHRRRAPAAACSADMLAVYASAIALRAALLWLLRHCPMIGTIGAAP